MKTALSFEQDGILDVGIPISLVTERGFRPRWLLRPYEAEVWLVADIGDRPPRECVFNVSIPDGGNLIDYPELYNPIKQIAYGVRTGQLAHVTSAAVQVTIVNNLTTLACWMIANNIERFSQLSHGDIDEYAKLAVYGIHNILKSESLLERYLESRIDLAQFGPEDSPELRRKKAANVFPCVRMESEICSGLNRTQILLETGLDQIGTHGRANVLASLLDEAEAMCAFAQSTGAKRRQYDKLSRDDYDDKPISEEHLYRFLMSFQYLWDHRRYIDDAIRSNPFPHSSARKLARGLGSEVGRTGTIPVKQAAHFVERAVRWVLDYAPIILDLKEWVEALYDSQPETAAAELARRLESTDRWPTGPSSPFPIILPGRRVDVDWDEMAYAQSHRSGMGLRDAILYLITACSVVIAAFSARRASEIIGLKEGCIFRDGSGNPWMRCFIHKTLMSESRIPIPEVVVSAVQILERLGKRARTITGSPYLFQYTFHWSRKTYGLSSGGSPNFHIALYLRRFGYFVDVPALKDGSSWTFKPHQFRRFFAVLYIWVYDKGDWGALQYHLKHFTHEMTRRYVSEDTIGQIIAVADREHTAEILANAQIGITHIGGIEGTRLKEATRRIYGRLAQSVEVVSERKFKQRITRYLERTGITLKAFPWGYCAERDLTPMEDCNCSNSGRPEYGRASERTCVGCSFNVVTPAHRGFLEQTLSFHRDIANSADAPEILRRASEDVQRKIEASLFSISPS